MQRQKVFDSASRHAAVASAALRQINHHSPFHDYYLLFLFFGGVRALRNNKGHAFFGNSDGPAGDETPLERTIAELIDKRSVHRFTSPVKKGDPLNF
jgi:hypothetical protein